MTPYAQAWLEYQGSIEYVRAVNGMIGKGMIQPYIDNNLRTAFDAGWNSKTTPDAK